MLLVKLASLLEISQRGDALYTQDLDAAQRYSERNFKGLP